MVTIADATVDRAGRGHDVPGTVAAHASHDVPVALTGQRAGDVLTATALAG